jgi:WD40 repeat protein
VGKIKNRFIDIRLSDLPTDFVRLAGHILREDPAQLGAQLSARLDADELAALSPQLQALVASAPLQLLHPSVGRMGGLLIATWSTDRYPSQGVLDAEDTLYFGLSDLTIGAWNVDRDLAPYRLASPEADWIPGMVYNPHDKSLAFGGDGEVLMGDRTWRIHDTSIRALEFTSGPWAVSIDSDYVARIWDVESGRVLLELERPDDPKKDSPDMSWRGFPSIRVTSTRVLFHDGVKVYSWNLQSGSLCWSRWVDTLNSGAFAVSPNGRIALIDSTLVDAEQGRPIAKLPHKCQTRHAVFSRDGDRLYTTERYDPTIYVREPIMGEALHSFTACECQQLLADSKNRIITLSPDPEYGSFSTVQWWNPNGREAVCPTHSERVGSVQTDRNGVIVLAHGPWHPTLWRAETGRAANTPERGQFLSDSGRYLLQVGNDVVVHDISAANSLALKRGPAGSDFKVEISPGAQYALFIKQDDGAMVLWDIAADCEVKLPPFEIPWTLGEPYHDVYALSADGSHLAIARCARDSNHDGCIEVWNLREPVRYRPLSVGHRIYDLRLSSGGRCGLFVTHEDGMVRFGCAEGEVRSEWEDRLAPAPIHGFAMTSDGRRGVSTTGNKATLWDLDRRCRLATFSGDNEAAACAISGDGSLVVVGERSRRLHLLQVRV